MVKLGETFLRSPHGKSCIKTSKTVSNSEDPNKTANYEPSHMDLRCLQWCSQNELFFYGKLSKIYPEKRFRIRGTLKEKNLLPEGANSFL